MNYRYIFTILSFMFYIYISQGSLVVAQEGNIRVQNQRAQFSADPPLPTMTEKEHRDVPQDTTILFYPEKQSPADFRLSLSQTGIDFGELSPTNPIIRALRLSIQPSNVPLYSILAIEDHPLQHENGFFIPDTSFDSGTCTSFASALWQNTLAYGFGYRCDSVEGSGCNGDFTNGTFKRFPSVLEKHLPVTIAGGKQSEKETTFEVTHKVNIAGTQQPGTYTNTITYILAPGF